MLGPVTNTTPSGESDRKEAIRLFDLAHIASFQYSPLSLRHLPQPVPKDAPANMDKSIFTFEDAFEDLLAVTAGSPMPDIRQKYEQRKLLRQMFQFGEPYMYWTRRLQASGLVSDQVLPPLGVLQKEIDRQASEVWERMRRGEDDPFARLMELRDEMFRNVPELSVHRDAKNQSRQQPDHEDDLFLPLQNLADSGRRSWDTLVKHMTEVTHQAERKTGQNQPAAASENKVEESQDEYVDKFGYVHKTIVQKEIDSNGNEVGSATIYQTYPAPANHKDIRDDNTNEQVIDYGGEDHDGADEARNKDGKSGWFWK
ncbi:hypothetical protein GMORB2_3096 [Geosmithia morbida]|uniref:Uncharacterized protein n=1 Tax=Geosmithia morbida TaxID=1094350 RepID=A0A9P4YQQ1_9HYPO|nr:uncharacterized protein GMORB2_3096 [Geosmithia morbida]KAF4120295.1 hypothetical protein GMORB2_3096 [Geosmithia morbida]